MYVYVTVLPDTVPLAIDILVPPIEALRVLGCADAAANVSFAVIVNVSTLPALADVFVALFETTATPVIELVVLCLLLLCLL